MEPQHSDDGTMIRANSLIARFRLLLVGWVCCCATSQLASETVIEEIVVTGDPTSLVARTSVGGISKLASSDIQITRANHPSEVFIKVPGVWVVKGSGQEHLTAMRSAVLAGGGACGAFLFLENNVPVRPTGFCNVNGLFELNTEQAEEIEVLRGPASSMFGGNALHGVINVRPFALHRADSRFSFEAGPHEYLQSRIEFHSLKVRMKAHSTSTNGYRHATGFGQQKANASLFSSLRKWEAIHTFSITNLNQETGGYVRGFRAYQDEILRQSNPNPEAYRDARSVRIASHWSTNTNDGGKLFVSPYFRRSSMEFLQHFLPGRPLEKNSQSSMGTMILWTPVFNNLSLTVGSQFEWMNGSLYQHQANETTGSAFLVATRPRGTHYNFDVDSVSWALFQDSTFTLGEKTRMNLNSRLEHLVYDYDNQHLVGNTKDDGSRCGFGGCLYTRPADRTDDFTNIAARLSVQRDLADHAFGWAVLGWGYRPPQVTELYRLQSGQTIADLDSERLGSLEAGVDIKWESLTASLASYYENSSNLIFRDAEGTNVSDGKTTSRGVEIEIAWELNDTNTLAFVSSIAQHRYAFSRDAARGEKIVDGNEVDSAPALIANTRWIGNVGENITFEFEVSRIGSHYVNAANTARYGGHTLAHVRGKWEAAPKWSFFGRILNLLDAEYADRADYAFGSYRYFPGAPRQIYFGVEYSL